jgi:hypothetical protein
MLSFRNRWNGGLAQGSTWGDQKMYRESVLTEQGYGQDRDRPAETLSGVMP